MRTLRTGLIFTTVLAAVLAAGTLPATAGGRHGHAQNYSMDRPAIEPSQARDRDAEHYEGGGVVISPFFDFDPFYVGWPYGYGYYGYWGYGCGYGPYGYYPPYGPWQGYSSGIRAKAGDALVILDVSPGRAHVLVDGADVGKARHFDEPYSPLWVKPGKHDVEFEANGYQPLSTSIDVKEGRYYKLTFNLTKGEAPKEKDSTAGSAPAKPE